MIAHLIGTKCCLNTSKEAQTVAWKVAGKAKATKEDAMDGDDESDVAPSKKRKCVAAVEKSRKQSELKVFKGINIPFNETQKEIIQTQFLHTTISANLPFCWVINPEVIKIFLMFRSTAGAVIPDHKVLSSCLLNTESIQVAQNIDKILKGCYVGIS
jgi:hypothetical protein